MLDRIVYIYECVRTSEFDRFLAHIDYLETNGLISNKYLKIGKGASEYHYNLHLESGAGGIIVSYKHNSIKLHSAKQYLYDGTADYVYDVRVEYNPSKIIGTSKINIVNAIQYYFGHHKCYVTFMDLAIDIDKNKDTIIVCSKNGREENRYMGTRYYGQRGKDGRLKIYDKKKEREKAGEIITQNNLTRIEYSFKADKPIPIDNLIFLTITPSQYYDIYIVKNIDIPIEVKCYLLAIQSGQAQIKQFTRTNQRKIKEALASYDLIDFDQIIQAQWRDILDIVYQICINYYQKDIDKIG